MLLGNRVVLVTGGSRGIGRAIAIACATAGADVALNYAGNSAAAEATAEAIRALSRKVLTLQADVADADAVETMVQSVVSEFGRIDVLINNAGALVHEYRTSPQGFEETYAVHVLSSFLLTELAVDVMPADGRVLTVTSGGMYSQSLRADMQERAEGFDGVRAYAKAKRAQVALTQEWARRYQDGPVFAVMHPGWADTPGVRTSLPTFRRVTGPILRTPSQGADTLVWLAGADVPSGRLWLDRRERSVLRVPRTQHDPEVAAELFDVVAAQVSRSVS